MILKVHLLSWILQKRLLFEKYHPPSEIVSYYFNNLDNALGLYSHYEKKLLVGDFKTKVSDFLSTFLYKHDLENLAKDKTCIKNANNHLFWLNNSLTFQNTTTTFTGLSYYHKLVLSLKNTFCKYKPKKLYYRDYKKFNFSDFNDDLKAIFSRITVAICLIKYFLTTWANMIHWNGNYQEQIIHPTSLNLCEKQLWEDPTLKKAITKANRKKAFKHITENFCCRLYKKERKRFFNNLNPSFVTDSRVFWKTIKPFLWNKGNYGSQILNSLKKMRYCQKMISDCDGTK